METGQSQRRAVEAFNAYAFVPNTLVDVSGREQTRPLFGKRYAAPFGVAPLGGAAISAFRGDLVLAEAARDFNVPMIMSATSLIKLEEVAFSFPDVWFQTYLPGDPARIVPMIARIEKAGIDSLVVTVDTPVPGNRENNARSGYSMPIRVTPKVALDCALHPRWPLWTFLRTLLRSGMPHFENMDATRGPPMFSRNLIRNLGSRDQFAWPHLELIRRKWPGKLVVKGILSLPDAVRLRDLGVDGIVLSSHGGRQLDHAVAPLEVLPPIRSQVPDIAVMLDGGIQRGTDVMKALALGADFVFVGRSFMFAAAVAGSPGVYHAMKLLYDEIDRNMAMLGVTSLIQLGPAHLASRTNDFSKLRWK